MLGNGLKKNSPIVAKQWLSEMLAVATNTHTKIEELLNVSFFMWSVSYQGMSVISSSQKFLFQFYNWNFNAVCTYNYTMALMFCS
jgi:hypothetical protein